MNEITLFNIYIIQLYDRFSLGIKCIEIEHSIKLTHKITVHNKWYHISSLQSKFHDQEM